MKKSTQSSRAYHQIVNRLHQNRRSTLGGRCPLNDDSVRHSISNTDTALEGTLEEMTAVDATSLRRQIIKLNRRLQLLEEENKERTRRDMVMYSITVAFWLLNSWIWLRR